MRPRRFTYTLAALDADGYVASANVNSVAVGAAYTIRSAATHPGDLCSHPVTIYSLGDISGTVFTITGTDAEGRSISENLTGGNAAPTVTSVKYYADVTSVVRYSGATGAVAFTVGYTALARTPIFPTNTFGTVGPTLGVVLSGTTVTYSGMQANGDVFTLASDTLYFVAITGMAAVTADAYVTSVAGTTGLRVHVASHTTGTLAITYSQGRG
jgi:hypothetical protein